MLQLFDIYFVSYYNYVEYNKKPVPDPSASFSFWCLGWDVRIESTEGHVPDENLKKTKLTFKIACFRSQFEGQKNARVSIQGNTHNDVPRNDITK